MVFTDEKFMLKNQVFYGSYYQENKYQEVRSDKYTPSRAFGSYQKDLKDNVNRKTTELGLKKKKEWLYGDTKIY